MQVDAVDAVVGRRPCRSIVDYRPDWVAKEGHIRLFRCDDGASPGARARHRPVGGPWAPGICGRMPDLIDLAGRVVIVTGASSGIGASTARLLHAAGAHPVLAARRADRLAALST